MSFESLPFGRITRMQWAVLDLLMTSDINGHAFANAFGRTQLPGQVTIPVGGTTVTGIGTDFTGYTKERLILGDQVAIVDSVTSTTELELEEAHTDGILAPEDFFQAPRGWALDADPLEAHLTTVAWPAFTVSVGDLAPLTPGFNNFSSSITILVAMYFSSTDGIQIRPRAGTTDLAFQAELILTDSAGLCVPRFDHSPLVDSITGTAQGIIGTRVIPNSNNVRVAGLALTWQVCKALATLPDFRWL